MYEKRLKKPAINVVQALNYAVQHKSLKGLIFLLIMGLRQFFVNRAKALYQ